MTAPHTESTSYEVGYGRPPRHTQFQKGRSGNPGGRPRKLPAERLKELALYEAYRTMIVMEDGHAVPLSAIQAVLRSQLQIAAAGNVRAQRDILTMIREIELTNAGTARVAATYGPVNGDDDADGDDDVADGDDIADGDDDHDDCDVSDGGDDGAVPAQQADAIDKDGGGATGEGRTVPSAGGAPPENAAAPPAVQHADRRQPPESRRNIRTKQVRTRRISKRAVARTPAQRQPGGYRRDRPSQRARPTYDTAARRRRSGNLAPEDQKLKIPC